MDAQSARARAASCLFANLALATALLFPLLAFAAPGALSSGLPPTGVVNCNASFARFGNAYQLPANSTQTPEPLLLTSEERQWLTSLPVLRVGFDVDAAPYSQIDADGRPAGLAIDFVTLLTTRLGVKILMVPYTGTQEGLELLRAKHLDLLATANFDRAYGKYVVLAAAYFNAPVIGITTDGHSVFHDRSIGRRLLYDPETVNPKELATLFPRAISIPAASTAAGLRALATGTADAYIGDQAQTAYVLRQVCRSGSRTLTPLSLQHKLSIGVAASIGRLGPLLDRALSSVSSTERQTLRGRWLATSSPAGASWKSIFLRLWPALATMLAILSVLAIAHHRLRREVTRRRISENALAQQLAFNQALLHTVPCPLVAKDNSNRLIAANTSYEALTGRPVALMLGKTSTQIGAFDSELDAHFESLSARVITDRTSRHGERTYIDRCGTEHSVLYWITPFGEGPDKNIEDTARDKLQLHGATAEVIRGGVLATLVDITDVRRAEARARESEQRLVDITSNLPAIVYKLRRSQDGDLSLPYVGGNPHPLFGLTPEQMMADERAAFDVVHPDDQRQLIDSLRAAANNQTGFSVEFRIKAPDGERWVHSRASFGGTALGNTEWDGYWIDTTDSHRQADELRAARQTAEAASDAKARFLATMSHEIRTPLSSVIGLFELLASTHLDARQAAMVRTAQTAATALLQIVGDVLDFSRIEAGHVTLQCTPIDVREIVEEVCATFSAAIAERGLNFHVEISPSLAGTVLGDGLRIRQILMNLLGNASKFTSHGHIRVTIDVINDIDDEQTIAISVEDTGIGIEKDELQRIFEPFTQARQPTDRHYDGTGLGLSICRELAALMRGELALSSHPDTGTTARLSFPARVYCRKPNPIATLTGRRATVVVQSVEVNTALTDILCRLGLEVVEQSTPADVTFVDVPSSTTDRDAVVQMVPYALPGGFTVASSGNAFTSKLSITPLLTGSVRSLCECLLATKESESSHPIAKPLFAASLTPTLPILVAEDQATSLIVIREQLRALGYHHIEVRDGAAALDALRHGRYAMLITDCQMPGLNGPNLTRIWREIEAAKGTKHSGTRIPIIGITASLLSNDAPQYLAFGMDEVLLKPVALDQLAQAIERHLQRSMNVMEQSPGMPAARHASPRRHKSASAFLGKLRDTYGNDDTVAELLDAAITSVSDLRNVLMQATDVGVVLRHLHDATALGHLFGDKRTIDACERWRELLRESTHGSILPMHRPPRFNRAIIALIALLRNARDVLSAQK
ncbi:ATP-binding protein [Burkholderia sp. Nafp2/4-1b]|uniref:ATP-binding protein n=1 Tax=Burkholderia sp. Nafp2/4-1b TaxID=2116686 RepID=UPI0013CE5694|nr:ATP-binding protein [Burkholderia sp. Nafp2/4-1b]